MSSLFATGLNSTLVDVDSMARFLYTFIQKTRSFKLYLGPYTQNDDGTVTYTTYPGDTEPAWIAWQSFRVATSGGYQNVGFMTGYLGDAGSAYYTATGPLLWTQLSSKLKQIQNYTFSLIGSSIPNGSLIVAGAEEAKGDTPAIIPGTYDFTSEFRLAGKWVKILGYNPFVYMDVTTAGKYLSFTTTKPLQFTLQTEGYDMLYVHSNFGKSVSAASSALDNNYIVPTNILWPIQIISNPSEKTYFVNYNTAGKVTYFMPILEEIEIYFTDEWGDRIVDYIDFQMVLTFDFAPPEPLPEPNTIKRARRELNL